MLEYKGYVGAVEAEDGAFAGRVLGLRDVITFEGTTFAEVEQAFRDSVDDYLEFCEARGEPPDRPYSGKIPLRVDPELHRRAALRAQGEGVSSTSGSLGELRCRPAKVAFWASNPQPLRLYSACRLRPAMAINGQRNKPIGPGGSTRRLHHQRPSS